MFRDTSGEEARRFADEPFGTTHRDLALMEWVARPPGGESRPFLFGLLRGNVDSAGIVPIDDRVVRAYVDGTKVREYSFALQVNLAVSADDGDPTNLDNMLLMRTWQKWVAERARKGEFPDFGPECCGYRLRIGQNAPRMALSHGNNMARYDFFATIAYTETSEEA